MYISLQYTFQCTLYISLRSKCKTVQHKLPASCLGESESSVNIITPALLVYVDVTLKLLPRGKPSATNTDVVHFLKSLNVKVNAIT